MRHLPVGVAVGSAVGVAVASAVGVAVDESAVNTQQKEHFMDSQIMVSQQYDTSRNTVRVQSAA